MCVKVVCGSRDLAEQEIQTGASVPQHNSQGEDIADHLVRNVGDEEARTQTTLA